MSAISNIQESFCAMQRSKSSLLHIWRKAKHEGQAIVLLPGGTHSCCELRHFDILSPNFDREGAVTRLKEASAERKICDVIMDQLLLPGVGNVIKDWLATNGV